MDSRHAALGRITLEEIRQKRAAEKLSKNSSKPPQADAVVIKKSESATRLSENDISALVSQLQEMQFKNAELELTNKNITATLQQMQSEKEVLQNRLNDLEQNTVPSLRKALKDVAMEKDAAFVAREDLSAQLRTLKRRLKEVEEEQYRAEEDAASLRAELNSLQQQAYNNNASAVPVYESNQMKAMEVELSTLRSKLEQEQQLLIEEKSRSSALVIQRQELEEKLASLSKNTPEDSSFPEINMTVEYKQRLEEQLHGMAVAVERLESSRQKLLMEIDSQSSEIERLFEENSTLSTSYQESMELAAKWENQVKACLQKNDELRTMLDELRTEQANNPSPNHEAAGDNNIMQSQNATEFQSLQGQLLAKEQSKAEALSAEVLRLSARLQHATQAYNNLARIYKPVLKNIENRLIEMKQDGGTVLVVQ